MQRIIRTRFAPSPTGFMHLGALRTALFNYLFAKQNKGEFILRIEDTDKNREVQGAIDQIKRTLSWSNIPADEGPYIQSQRTDLYREHVFKLEEQGHVYKCWCTPERLKRLREDGERKGTGSMYDRHCLHLTEAQRKRHEQNGDPFVLRMLIPKGYTEVEDSVYGKSIFRHDSIDDQVLLKSDGYPTYHLANVIDDHAMQISHVIRGEEWLPSTPKHIILYKMLNWQPPTFAHLPLLVNENREKLSKRHGHASVDWYKEQGYLPAALVNFVALLGWSPGSSNDEIFDLEELTERFSLSQINKGSCMVNLKKLDWINGQHIRRMSENINLSKSDASDSLRKFFVSVSATATPSKSKQQQQTKQSDGHVYQHGGLKELMDYIRPQVMTAFENSKTIAPSEEYFAKAVLTVRERLFHLNDFVKYFMYFFVEPDLTTAEAQQIQQKIQNTVPHFTAVLSLVIDKFAQIAESEWTHEAITTAINELKDKTISDVATTTTVAEIEQFANVKLTYKDLISVVRFYVTGASVGASISPTLETLTKETVLRRLRNGLQLTSTG